MTFLPEDAVVLDMENHLHVTLAGDDRERMLAKVNRALILGNVSLYTVAKKENRKLEDVFIELTEEGGGQIA